MHALVVGADGFAGRWLLQHLAESGDTADAIVGPRFTPPLPNAATYRQIDVRDEVAVREFVGEKRPEAIYYLAGISQRGEREAWASAAGISLFGSVNALLAGAELANTPRFLYVSTGMVYATSMTPIDETGREAPLGAYPSAKLAAERALRELGRSARLDVIVARPFNHTGPGQSQAFVVPHIAARIAAIAHGESGPAITLSGPDAVRDFSDVRDVVRAYRLLITKGAAGDTFNVGSGSGISISQMAALMRELAGISARIVLAESHVRDQQASLVANTQKVRGLGWAPERTLRRTLSDVLAQHMRGHAMEQITPTA